MKGSNISWTINLTFKNKTAKEINRTIALELKKYWDLMEIFNIKINPLVKGMGI